MLKEEELEELKISTQLDQELDRDSSEDYLDNDLDSWFLVYEVYN